MPVPQFHADNKIVIFKILEFLGFCDNNKISISLPPWGPDVVSAWEVGGGMGLMGGWGGGLGRKKRESPNRGGL